MKPHDIPQDVWDKAFYHMDDFALLSWIDGDDELLFQRCVSEAIMAAVAEEREQCAKIVTGFELEADDAAPNDYIDGYEAGVNEFSVFSAQAIRNRSNT